MSDDSEREVLISFGFFLKVPSDHELAEKAIDRFRLRMRTAFERIAREAHRHGAEITRGPAYTWLGDSDVNAKKCIKCGKWTTDVEERCPEFLLNFGHCKGILGLICDECSISEDEFMGHDVS